MVTSSVNRLASPRENKSDKQNLITDVSAAVFILTDIDYSTSVAMNIWILWVSIQNRFTHKSLYRCHYAIDYQPTLTLKTTLTNITNQSMWTFSPNGMVDTGIGTTICWAEGTLIWHTNNEIYIYVYKCNINISNIFIPTKIYLNLSTMDIKATE